MFVYQKKVFLRDTDATGVIYFTALFQYALEAMESFLSEKRNGLSTIFSQGYLLPIVHAQADLKTPLRVGDEVLVELFLGHIGTRSFSLETKMWKMPDKIPAGNTKIVHAFLLQGEENASPIPKSLIDFLGYLSLK